MSTLMSEDPVADKLTTQFADIVNRLIDDCRKMEDQINELQTQLASVTAERDSAVQDLENGEFGDVDLREYCECCNRFWHRDYVTWFHYAFETSDGRHVHSACGRCFDQVPVGHEPDPV